MKTLKIKLIGFWGDFDVNNHIIFKILKQKYIVEIVDSNPDYIICSVFGDKYEYLKYPQVRIMISGENYIPDFNFIDYSICSYPICFLDRNYRVPQCFLDEYSPAAQLKDKDRNYSLDILNTKPYFANFIASHDSENNIRGIFFKELSKYKRIESCGILYNNMPDGKTVNRLDNSKIEIQKKSKFTMCFESTKHEGFITEKIADAFFTDTIPIYYGSSDVADIFNPKAFINCSDYSSIEDVIERIKQLDNNDSLYLSVLREPIFNNEYYYDNLISGLRSFLYHIFDQDSESAFRRSRVYSPQKYEQYILKAKRESAKYKRLLEEGASKKELKLFIKNKLMTKFKSHKNEK